MTKANECTCPSGDGSLRHPCPAHPASVELAGVGAKLTFINGRPAMCGCQVEYSSGGGEYSDVIDVTLCAKHSGSAILDLVATNRIALTPEYEGQWHADFYLDREIPLAKAEGATPAEAVLALMSAERIDPEQESVEQAGGDERDLQAEGAQGERDGWGPLPIVQVPWNVFDRAVMWVEDRRRYGDDGTIVDDWKALKTIQRAALAQPSQSIAAAPTYQFQSREIGESDWAPCDFRWYLYCSKSPEMDTRVVEVAAQPSPAQVECIDCHSSGFCMSISNEEIRCPCGAPIKFSGPAQAEGFTHFPELMESVQQMDAMLKANSAQAERPEVVGSAWRNIYNNGFDHVAPFPPAPGGPVVDEPLMTVAQHERIVEARWNRAMDLMGEHVARISEKFKAERDAALAEVERLRQFERICEGLPQDATDGGWTVQGIRRYAKRLEDQLKVALARVAELEKQEPVAWTWQGVIDQLRRGDYLPEGVTVFPHKGPGAQLPLYIGPVASVCQVSEGLAEFSQFLSAVMDAAGLVRYGRRSKELSEYLGAQCMKYRLSAPVAQAQHSVPDHAELLQALERTHAGHMVGHDQSDQPKGGYSDGYVNGFGECIKVARKVLAAAPGKEGL